MGARPMPTMRDLPRDTVLSGPLLQGYDPGPFYDEMFGVKGGQIAARPHYQDLAQHPALAVEREEAKLLHLEIPQPGRHQPGHIGGLPDPGPRGAGLPGHPCGELEGGQEAGRLGGPHPGHAEELGRGPGRQAAQRPSPRLQQAGGHFCNTGGGASGP